MACSEKREWSRKAIEGRRKEWKAREVRKEGREVRKKVRKKTQRWKEGRMDGGRGKECWGREEQSRFSTSFD